MNGDIYVSVVKTLAFFDLFNHPLTAEELFGFLWQPPALNRVAFDARLAELIRAGQIGEQGGFYFLPGRGDIIGARAARVALVDYKLAKARRAIKKIAWVPFMRAVFVCNNVALGTANADSDIDVLIVARAGRIWIVRLLVTLTLSLWGLRRTRFKIRDRVCLSFYTSDIRLNLRPIALCAPDVYLAYWLSTLIPFYDPDQIFEAVKSANGWVKEFLPRAFEQPPSGTAPVAPGGAGKKIKGALEKMWAGRYGDLVESQARELQKAKMKMNRGSAQNAGDTRVVVSDEMLKFHENDRREEYRRRWMEKINQFT